jgi:hypothetical protein
VIRAARRLPGLFAVDTGYLLAVADWAPTAETRRTILVNGADHLFFSPRLIR